MSADYKTLLGLVRELVERPLELDPVGGDWLARARAAIEPSKPKNDVKILHAMAGQEPCCKPRFMAAGRSGKLDGVEEWTCPKCGTVWRPGPLEGNTSMLLWDAVPDAEVLHLP